MTEAIPGPLVSVIIPVMNGERFLAAAIESVVAQSYRPCEIIVVDGQSSDGTAEIAKSFRGVRYLYQSGELGIAAARNLGLAAARGDLIAFISHDDMWAPDKLRLQVDYMTRHPEIQYTLTQVRFFLEEGCSAPAGFRKELLEGERVGRMSETLVARKSLFKSIGEFDPEFVVNEDSEWFSRAMDRHVPSAVIPQVLVYKRIHDGNVGLGISGRLKSNPTLLKIAKQSIHRKRSRNNPANGES